MGVQGGRRTGGGLLHRMRMSPSESAGLSAEQVGRLRKLVHDLNNVVTSLLASGHVLRHELPETDSLHEVAVDIESAGQRANALTLEIRKMLKGVHFEDAVRSKVPTALAGHETILLVEDEPSVKRTIGRILRDAGYKVLEAADATEALTITERYEYRIQLLLTDYLMPGVTGDELAREVRFRRPDIRVLMMSGYLGNRTEALPVDGPTLLQKPFTAHALMSRVREALDARHVLPLA